MKIFFKGLLVLAALLIIFLIGGMLLPENLKITRSIVVHADADRVYPYISNFRLFNQWSPWARLDPDAEFIYEGAKQGEGAIMHWRSKHPELGKGSQKIVKASPGRDVSTVLVFAGMGKAYSHFVLAVEQGSTKVTWSFDVHFGYNIPGRIAGLLLDDSIVGYYELGLENLKRLVEQQDK